MYRWGPLALVLAACAGDRPDTTDRTEPPTDDDPSVDRETDLDTATETDVVDTDPPAPCTSGVDTTSPAPNALDAYFRGPFYVTFQDDERAHASFSLRETWTGRTRGLGPVEWSPDGLEAVLTPSAPLAPGNPHVLTITYSCGTASIPFTTSDVGLPVDPADVLARTYVADLATAIFVEPPGIHAILQPFVYMVEYDFALVPKAHDAGAGTIELYTGWLDGWGLQDTCTLTTPLPPAAFDENPWFTLSAPSGLDLPLGGHRVRIHELDLAGAYREDGTGIEGLELSGKLDVTTLAPLVGLQPSEVCWTFAYLTNGVATCGPCPDGGTGCIDARIVGLVAEEIPGVSLREIGPADLPGWCPQPF